MSDKESFLKETETLHNLRALEEIERNPQISQRELSNHLGVALGITNALIKALVRKGLIKIRGENNRSLTYHVTHAGILAKSKLAVRWTLNTIDYYRQARIDIAGKLSVLANEGIETVVLYGLGELAEVAMIVAPEVGLVVQAFIEEGNHEQNTIFQLPVGEKELIDKIKPDAIVVCVILDESRVKELTKYANKGVRVYDLAN